MDWEQKVMGPSDSGNLYNGVIDGTITSFIVIA